jgi:predicted ATP-binding protein involved in virulence
MKIKQISVTGLFGIFDHVIPLNMDDRITIVHGPNGFGKTAMLRILNGFFNFEYSIIWTIPFVNFQIIFENGNQIEISKKLYAPDKKTAIERVQLSSYIPGSGKETFSLDIVDILNRSTENLSANKLASKLMAENLAASNLAENFLRAVQDNKTQEAYKAQEDFLKSIKSGLNVRLIESQRLLNFVSNHSSEKSSQTESEPSLMLSTVSHYSNEIAQTIGDKFREYGEISQSLDRTFPNRLVQRQSSPNLTDEQLRAKLEQLEATRSRLIKIGLLDNTENSEFSNQPPAMDESTKNILSVYVEDVEKKLSVFYDLANKIELLRNIINSKFAYSYKEMNFNKDKGFVFKTLYHSSISDSDTLLPTDLSSGEQHELVLLYELLFKVEPKSLVLIDEPELSLHVGWQVQFLKDLQDIVKLADLDILMATHSPDIIQDRWDLTVELQGMKK